MGHTWGLPLLVPITFCYPSSFFLLSGDSVSGLFASPLHYPSLRPDSASCSLCALAQPSGDLVKIVFCSLPDTFYSSFQSHPRGFCLWEACAVLGVHTSPSSGLLLPCSQASLHVCNLGTALYCPVDMCFPTKLQVPKSRAPRLRF